MKQLLALGRKLDREFLQLSCRQKRYFVALGVVC